MIQANDYTNDAIKKRARVYRRYYPGGDEVGQEGRGKGFLGGGGFL